ncbi:hypothetical protein NIES2135_63760 (plasmid) [Leptolyngbya boryana NIES-2135]|jgi:hypothetical protein|uniref:Uncharacterized protein n=1 Tax=Leptolyngbya boryana NIES-2135 TaxID=1973484 RepID=A0A1Z4JRY3_LEPBY|nr:MULTISPECIES: hypothetical protein [Leptolyngbya]BAY59499.1 hypothetical protein NIES2135_63760 [Leptolyngbya boryana NIES-2135]MBD2373080.1 hypothetical protein [Leptolyngbya sp. FACHB-238]MBD2397165.1 hypothetical protein [Leptolyngbya sp. FACHB-239]MBD2404029.1 hypothetical protein [Leptolyngbya sp. FACHB-402]ULP33321.1 hypothetical protein MCP04_31645 [Leptolyngbya boryana IU 594]
MKSITLLGLLVSALIAYPVKAQPSGDRDLTYNLAIARPSSSTQTSPVDLAFLAYRGYLKNQDSDSYNVLVTRYISGSITSKNIVQAAINDNLVSASALNDRGYLSALDATIRDFEMR